jgi:rhodanese-related sulfurtransferase
MTTPSVPTDVPTVTAAAVPDDAYLLDVREPYEWVEGHAPGARHVPMYEIHTRLAEVPTVGPVVVVCKVGARSAQVAAYLQAQGWDNVLNLAGGLYAWQAAGRPLISDTGTPARVV